MVTTQASRTGRSYGSPSVQLPGGNIVHEVKSACNFIWTNFSAKLRLSKCPEVRVQGSTDTSPSSLPKEDSIKSVSVRDLFGHKPACWLTCLLAS